MIGQTAFIAIRTLKNIQTDAIKDVLVSRVWAGASFLKDIVRREKISGGGFIIIKSRLSGIDVFIIRETVEMRPKRQGRVDNIRS